MRGWDDFQWCSCDGGPHLFMPAELLDQWEGVNRPSRGRVVDAIFRFSMNLASPATDYDRACDVNDLLGVIPVGDGHALVLGDEVPMSTWIAHPDGRGGDIVVLMQWADDARVFRRIADSPRVPDDRFEATDIELLLRRDDAVLLPASDSGPKWVYGATCCPLPAARYRVRTAELTWPGEGKGDIGDILRVHRLRATA
jgi:hypothetical protein